MESSVCMRGGDHHLVRQLSAPALPNRWVMLSHRALYQMEWVNAVAQRVIESLVL